MSKVFFPEISELVPASLPHPPNTEYKVSIGVEEWDGKHIPVLKVQMVYEGVVAGRRSPSYPLGKDDYLRVDKVARKLVEEHLKK